MGLPILRATSGDKERAQESWLGRVLGAKTRVKGARCAKVTHAGNRRLRHLD